MNQNRYTLLDDHVRLGEMPPEMSCASVDARFVCRIGRGGVIYFHLRDGAGRDARGRYSGRIKARMRNERKGRSSYDFRAARYVVDNFGDLVVADVSPQNK